MNKEHLRYAARYGATAVQMKKSNGKPDEACMFNKEGMVQCSQYGKQTTAESLGGVEINELQSAICNTPSLNRYDDCPAVFLDLSTKGASSIYAETTQKV